MSKQCPYCKELSPDDFGKCQWCGKTFDGFVETKENFIASKQEPVMQEEIQPKQQVSKHPTKKRFYSLIFVIYYYLSYKIGFILLKNLTKGYSVKSFLLFITFLILFGLSSGYFGKKILQNKRSLPALIIGGIVILLTFLLFPILSEMVFNKFVPKP
ncbi:MAG: hypothetical protein WC947_10260 [Elusimicrobiota bacterium]